MYKIISMPKFHKYYIKRVNITIDKFPLKNYKIVQLSDIHLHQDRLNEKNLKDIIKEVLKLKPDIVFITGDLIDSKCNFSQKLIEPLKELSNRVDCYFVLGNHEFGAFKRRVDTFLNYLRDIGIKPLVNSSVIIEYKGQRYNLVGLSDYTGVFFDLPPLIDKSFKDIDKSLSTIVLVHRAGWVRLFRRREFNLVISGHNHGGQVAPLGLLVARFRCKTKFLKGLYRLNKDKYVYVSAGIGYSRLPIRVFAKSEISLIVIN